MTVVGQPFDREADGETVERNKSLSQIPGMPI